MHGCERNLEYFRNKPVINASFSTPTLVFVQTHTVNSFMSLIA